MATGTVKNPPLVFWRESKRGGVRGKETVVFKTKLEFVEGDCRYFGIA